MNRYRVLQPILLAAMLVHAGPVSPETTQEIRKERSYESLELVDINLDGTYRRDNSDIVFRQITPSMPLPQKDGYSLPLGGQTWAIAWGDADNDLYPDLYLNHHTRRSTGRPEVPFSHLLFNPGAPAPSRAYADLGGVDQHSAIFIDINGDGHQDLFELQGGRKGKATPESHGTKNRVILGDQGNFSDNNRADDFQLGYAQGRGRNLAPLNINGALGLIVMNAPREDGLFPTTFFLRTTGGLFEERPGQFIQRSGCKNTAGAGKPCDRAQPADLTEFRLAIPAYFNNDDYIDVIFLGSKNAGQYPVKLFTGSAEGIFTASPVHGPGTIARDGAVLDADNDGRFDVWLTGIQKERRHRRTRNSLYAFSPEGEFLRKPLDSKVPVIKLKTGPVVSGDFDNDGDEDVITYEADGKNRFIFSVWENIDKGLFRRSLFTDQANTGFPRSVAVADYNLDGSLDLLFGDGAGHKGVIGVGGYVLIEGVPNGNHWLQLDLRDPWHLRGLGARVFVTAGKRIMLRGSFGGTHEAAQNHDRLHFGLGRYDRADIRVVWPDGISTELKNVPVDRVLEIQYPVAPAPLQKPG